MGCSMGNLDMNLKPKPSYVQLVEIDNKLMQKPMLSATNSCCMTLK